MTLWTLCNTKVLQVSNGVLFGTLAKISKSGIIDNMKNEFNLNDYISPEYEQSYYKGIPLEFRTKVSAILKSKGYKFRFRFRGSKKHSDGSVLLKNAKTFAVYRKY